MESDLDRYRKYLESQLEGAQAQIDDHPHWLEQGYVESSHLAKWKGAKYAFEESLRQFESMFFYEP